MPTLLYLPHDSPSQGPRWDSFAPDDHDVIDSVTEDEEARQNSSNELSRFVPSDCLWTAWLTVDGRELVRH